MSKIRVICGGINALIKLGIGMLWLGGAMVLADDNKEVGRAVAMLKGEIKPVNYELALNILSASAGKGIPEAHTWLGMASLLTLGTRHDMEVAYNHFEKGSELGDPEAFYMLYRYWSAGWIKEPEQGKAKQALQKSADLGYLKARIELLEKKLPNMPSPQPDGDITRILDELKRLAENESDRNAAYALGAYHAGSRAQNPNNPETQSQLKKLVNLGEANRYMTMAAERGSTEAIMFLAHKASAAQNAVEAARWYRMGHLRGDAACSVRLANVLRLNVSARQSGDPDWYETLLHFYQLDHPDAAFLLGSSLNHNRGYSSHWVDWKRSTECLEKYLSYQQKYGNPYSEQSFRARAMILAMCYEGGFGQPRDLYKVVKHGSPDIVHGVVSTKMVGAALLHSQSPFPKDRDTLVKAYGCLIFYQIQGGDRKEGGMRGDALEHLRALHGLTNAEVKEAERVARERDFGFVNKLLKDHHTK